MKNFIRYKRVVALLFIVVGLLMLVDSAATAAESTLSKGVYPEVEEPAFLFQQQTPEADMLELPDDDRDRFMTVAEVFSHPQTRIVIPQSPNARMLVESPFEYDRYQVDLKGNIIRIQEVERLLSIDWPKAYVIAIDDGSAWVSLLYRGDVSRLSVGETINVSGVFVADGNAIHADVVYPENGATTWLDQLPFSFPFLWQDNLPLALPIAAIVLIVTGVLALLVGIGRRIFSVLLIPIVLSIGITSCEFQIENVIYPTGEVYTATRLSETTENVDFFYEIPGVQRYIGSWIAHLRDEGLAVENWVADEQEFFYFQQRHPDMASFSSLDEDEIDSDTWVYATSYQTGDFQCFRYLANVDPQELYTTPPGTDQMAVNELHKYLDNMDFTYSVTLPGRVTFGNYRSSSGNRMAWNMDTKRSNQIVAESCLYLQPAEGINWTWGWVGVGGLGMINIGLWIFAFGKRKKERLLQV